MSHDGRFGGRVLTCICVAALLWPSGHAYALDTANGDFLAFWTRFRVAALADKPDAVASMTRFPFLEKGIVPGITTVRHSRESFLKLWAKLLEQDSGERSSTMRTLIAEKRSVAPNEVGQSGRTAQVGMFEFQKTSQGWRFTAAFVSD
jgi:hypothetical protein